MSNKNTRGSEWRKWDLHIHTPASDGKGSPEEIVSKAIEQGLSVIAITDHHAADYIDKVRNAAIGKNIAIISGIEFSSEYGSKSVHFIAYFPEYNGTTHLDSTSLHDLILSKLNLSRTSIIAKGKEQDPSLDDDQAFKKGMFLVHVDFKTAADLVHQYGGIISVHNGKKENGLDAEVKHFGNGTSNVHSLYEGLGTMKEELMRKYIDICDIGTSDNERDRNFYLEQFNHPSIICSDAHKLSEIGKSFTWIKADPTFEGLKQILYEPEARVRIQQDKPDDKKGYQVIDSVTLQENEFWNNTIYLNENLNTIIGGRSTGKSTLLKSIAKKIDDKISMDEEETDFIEKHLKGVSVKWKDDLGDETSRYIQFLPQNYMHAIAKNEDRKLDKLIERIISNKDENNALQTYNDSNKEIEKSLSKNIVDAFQLQNELKTLQFQLKEIGDKQGIEKEIERLNQKINELSANADISADEIEEYQDAIKQISKLQQQIEEAKKDIQFLNSLKKQSVFNDDIIYQFDNLSETIKSNVARSFERLKEQVTKQWNNQLDGFITERNNKKEEISKTKTDVENSEIVKKGQKYYANNKEIADIQEKLKEETLRLQKIEAFENKIKNTTDRKNKMVGEIVNEHLKYKTNANSLKDQLSIDHDDVKISTKIKCQSDIMYDFLKQKFNLKVGKQSDYVDWMKNNYDAQTEEVVKSFLEDALQNKIDFKNYNIAQNVINEFFIKNWYEYSFELTYQKDNFNEMSPGKKAFVILKLLLEFDTRECPILIDQPEDSLDNRAIYNELVQYIKDKKQTRQIILVTHNPNVVVSADSENVIVANQHGSKNKNDDDIKFQYINGSLENSKMRNDGYNEETDSILSSQGIREHVCDILEGGQEAFEKREKKYGFTN